MRIAWDPSVGVSQKWYRTRTADGSLIIPRLLRPGLHLISVLRARYHVALLLICGTVHPAPTVDGCGGILLISLSLVVLLVLANLQDVSWLCNIHFNTYNFKSL